MKTAAIAATTVAAALCASAAGGPPPPADTAREDAPPPFTVLTDPARTAFCLSFPDPEPELRALWGFAVGYYLEIEATPPGGAAETFSTIMINPESAAPKPGWITLFHVEERVWPEGTRFRLFLYDRDGNSLPTPH